MEDILKELKDIIKNVLIKNDKNGDSFNLYEDLSIYYVY